MSQTRTCNRKQPNTPDTDVSDSDPSLTSQAQVGDGVNNSHVALHTGEDVKQCFSIPGKIAAEESNRKNVPIGQDANAAQEAPQDCYELHDNQVVNEDIWVTHDRCCGGGTLLPPLSETLVQNQDTDWKNKKDVRQVECNKVNRAWPGEDAVHVKGEAFVWGWTICQRGISHFHLKMKMTNVIYLLCSS